MPQAKLIKKIINFKTVAVNSNIFIYQFEENKKYFNFTNHLLKLAEQEKKIKIYFSVIGVAELLTGPAKSKNNQLYDAYIVFFDSAQNIKIINVNYEAAKQAAKLRVNYNIKTPDALHLACAIESGCEVFITNDKDLEKVQEIKIIVI